MLFYVLPLFANILEERFYPSLGQHWVLLGMSSRDIFELFIEKLQWLWTVKALQFLLFSFLRGMNS